MHRIARMQFPFLSPYDGRSEQHSRGLFRVPVIGKLRSHMNRHTALVIVYLVCVIINDPPCMHRTLQ
jgi:hypothetical protein